MSINRVFLVLLAVLLLPGLALAQTTTRATFNVTKNFDDNNDASVTVHIDCDTGLPLEQSQSINEWNDVTFVVESFDDGQMDCEVWEGDVEGYSAESSCGWGDDESDSSCSDNSSGCSYESVNAGDENTCNITNYPDAQEVTVYKDWVIEGDGGDAIDSSYKITLTCDNEIEGGNECKDKVSADDDYGYCQEGTWSKKWWNHDGLNDTSYTADVIPDWDGGTNCWVSEKIYDSSVEVNDDDCSDLNVEIAEEGEGCTVTNTVFYEGIPTLSQYGLAILALLMLGVGFVGFRRFV